MMKSKHRIALLLSLLIICVLFAVTVAVNQEFNANDHVLEFDDRILEEGGVNDDIISVRIAPRGYQTSELSSWYHTYHTTEDGRGDHNSVGTIYEMEITNLTPDAVSEWTAEITIPVDTMFNSGWNGVFKLHQDVNGDEQVYAFDSANSSQENIPLDYIWDQGVLLIPLAKGDYFVYQPSVTSSETPIAGSNRFADDYTKKTIGFITYTEGVNTNYVLNFANGSITYKMSRSIFREKLFILACILLWIWIVLAVSMLIVSFKMKKVEKERLATEALIHKFEMDDLTKTFTRQAFFHYAEKLLENTEEKYTAAIVEIDNFKIMHSQYGETICNELLIYVADYLMNLFPDGYVGRFSRSRYAIIFEEREGFEVEAIIDPDMIKASPMPNMVLKLGIYTPIDTSVTIRRCYDRVSLALQKVRGIYGQNIAYYDDSMESQLLDEHKIEEYMEVALLERQFQVYYQPKHDAGDKKLIGAEALVRWIHPKYGFMSPGQFIPIFERTGFITKVDAYVFEKVCHDLKEWQDKGIANIPISINMSRKDFYEDEWITQRLAVVDALGIDTQLIHIEVTESQYAEEADVIKDKIDRIRARGIKIEMDDFGNGYSSLGMLAGISLDVLKLDMSFIRDIETTEVVVESIIALGHKLGLSIVAEGVETENQFEIVRKHGCDYIQGYYFAKPMKKEEFEEYLKKNS